MSASEYGLHGRPVNLTATGQVSSAGRAANLVGFYVNSTTAGTIVLRNGSSSGTAVSGMITPAIGWHAFPAACENGVHATLGGTIDVTFFVKG